MAIRSLKHPVTAPLNRSAALAFATLAVPATLCAQPAAPAAGTPPESTLPEIKANATAESDYKADTVASPKFTQPLVDTPQTISVIKKEIIRQQAATTLTEALRNTPGITLQLGENGNTTTGDSVFMRGFDTTNSIFVDGIRDLGAISRDVFNIEQIEVVKGPSGSDNGRGASSGYINLVSKVPGLRPFNDATLTVGTHRRARATADLERPFDVGVPGSAWRLNLMAQDYGVPGRDQVKSKRVGFAPAVVFGLGTPTRVYFNYLLVDQKNRPDGGVSTFGLPGYIFTAGSTPGPAVDPSNYYGARGDFDDVRLHMFTARVDHQLGPATVLRNTTRLGSTVQDFVLTGVNAVQNTSPDPRSFTVTRSRQGRHQSNEILTNQTNVNTAFATGAARHALSTGFEFIYERQNQENAQTLTDTTLPASLQQPRANLYAPNIDDVFLAPPFKGAYTKGSTLSAAVYAFDTLTLSERWLFDAGVRWEKFRTETNGSTFTAATATAPETLVQNAPLALTDTLVSWKASAVFKPTVNSSVYATVSNSFQPPGGANFALSATATNQANPAQQAQEGRNIEIGTKWDLLGGRLGATAAVFRSENENELISDGTAANNFTPVGKRRVEGVELGLVGQLTPALDLSAAVAYMDPKIIRGVPQGANQNQGGLIVFSPKVTFTSWLGWKLPGGFTLGAGARYVDNVVRTSNVNVAVTNSLPGAPSYWVADAMVAYDVSKSFGLQLNLYNLFDKAYVALVNNGGSRYIPGQARNALLTANLRF